MSRPQYLAEGNRVVLTAAEYRELLERCGELPAPTPLFAALCYDADIVERFEYCDECGAVPQIDDGKHAVTCKRGEGR